MERQFGKVKISRLSKAWVEATFVWSGDLKIEGEDEAMIINYLITWRFLPLIEKKDRCPLIWSHVNKNLEEVIKKWLLIDGNSLALQNVRYFSICMLMVVLDKIWTSNYNVTIMRNYRPVLQKAAKDIENYFRGGFRNRFIVL